MKSIFYVYLFFWFQRTIKIGCRCTSVNQEICTGDKCTAIAHYKFSDICHFVGCAGTTSWTFGKHILIKIATRTVKFVKGKWRNNNTGRNRVDTRATLTPLHSLSHHALYVAPFRHLVGVQCVANILRLQNIERQKLLGWRGGKLLVSFGTECRHSVSALARNGYAHATVFYHFAHLL